MTLERYRNGNPKDADELASDIEATLKQLRDTAPTVEGTQNYAFIQSFGRTVASNQEQALNDLYDAAYVTDATGLELTKKARELGVQRQSATEATGVVKFSREKGASTNYVIPEGTRVSTGGDNSITFATTETTELDGPYIMVNSIAETTSSTTFVTADTLPIDVTNRDTLTVNASIKSSNSGYTTTLKIVNITDNETLDTFGTTSTSLTNVETPTYDVSGYSGTIKIEFQLKVSDSNGTATVEQKEVRANGEVQTFANVRATTSGVDGNVGANTITVLVENPNGVESVTNPNPIGNTNYTLTDGVTPQQKGRDRESDSSLRQRVLQTREQTALALESLDGVISARVNPNPNDTATANGLSPWHTELQVYGGDINVIATKLIDVLPITTLYRLEGGVNGTKETTTKSLNLIDGTLTIPITRPTKTSLSLDIDIVVTDTYSSNTVVKDSVIEYIGGTQSDGSETIGLGQGANVLVNKVERVIEEVSGVEYADITLIDADGDGTDNRTTDSDGVPIYDVASSEVPTTSPSKIQLSVTQR